jgi:hypothetical protein
VSRVYTSPDSEIARIAAWTRDHHGAGYAVVIYPMPFTTPALSLSWHMTAENARKLAAMLVAAADAIDAGIPEVEP